VNKIILPAAKEPISIIDHSNIKVKIAGMASLRYNFQSYKNSNDHSSDKFEFN
jgi:hypothetical protein